METLLNGHKYDGGEHYKAFCTEGEANSFKDYVAQNNCLVTRSYKGPCNYDGFMVFYIKNPE